MNIKKQLLYGIIFFISVLGYSQIRENGTIEIAPIIGYSSSVQLHSIVTQVESVSGVQFGAHVDYYFNDRWSIRSGIFYQNMGVENKSDILDIFDSEQYTEKSNYLTIPLVANYHFGSTRKWYVNYGVSAGSLLSSKADFYDGNGYIDIKNSQNSFQFGLNAGIGYKLEISPKFILLFDTTGMIGLTDSSKERTGKNLYTSLNIGTVFKL